ncbi:MAG: thiamine diphosphokinase [Pasteurellaceae bacterium]|nr:thiamine diphosphokinase [Pasteurellaceae bacterium]
MTKALLFLNGEPPQQLPDLTDYDLIACTDGALHYLLALNLPLEKLDFISGDFDSYSSKTLAQHLSEHKLIATPDQNHTDFYKALNLLKQKGITQLDVFGASGRSQDHFMGNLHCCYSFRQQMQICCFDAYSRYFFIPSQFSIEHIQGKTLSLLPYANTTNVVSQGLKWELTNQDLSLTTQMSLRNVAIADRVTIRYQQGALIMFIAH